MKAMPNLARQRRGANEKKWCSPQAGGFWFATIAAC
jgi:hypothetical protein